MALQNLLDKVKSGMTDSPVVEEVEDLDDFEEEFGFDADDELPADPKPSRVSAKPDSKPVKKRAASPARVTKAKKEEIRDFLVLMITMPAATLSMKDPHCAGAFLDNADRIADALVPLICRNPAMLAWFTTGTGMFDYFILLQALQPVATTIWQHHVTKSIDHDHDHGEENYDYSGFTAPSFN